MKRIWFVLFLAIALRVVGWLPFSGNDVAELVPAETLTVDWEQNQVVLRSGDDSGYGEDWDGAMADLENAAEGVLFLGTVKQVVISKRAVHLLPDVVRSNRLRPSSAVCVCSGGLPAPEDASKYLSAHDVGVTIQNIQAAMLQEEGVRLPVLEQTKGGLRLRGSEDR